MPENVDLALFQAERFSWRSTNHLCRRLIGRLKRWARWEFWPPYVFYPPVIAYLGYLALRHRSLTLFTAVNPGIPASGFVGESKQEILLALKGAGSFLPKSKLLTDEDSEVRLETALAFMEEHSASFPIVLKPDAGQRGSGVTVVRSLQQMRQYLERANYPVIIQEYVAGKEFGVFYVRHPGEDRGRIFSITEKQMPVVVGNGGRTLEELILHDQRAVCMEGFYLQMNSDKRDSVVAAGERVQLVELGTHCRGAVFLDGSYAASPALEQAIDTIAHCFDGFYFGRFDIRVPSVEDFMAGKNFKVIELNGVTSEATHIYDPKLTLLDAYRTLFRQWKIAFEIGSANRACGAKTTSIWELLKALRDYRQVSRDHLS